MTLEVERDALLGALKQVADVVASRNTIPVLGNLLLEAADGALTVTGTDLDIEANATIEAAGTISTTIDKDKLLAAIGSLKPGRVTIAPADGRASAVTIKGGRAVRTLSTLPASDFPKRPAPECATAFTMQGAALDRLLDTCHVAQSSDEVRYFLMGVYLHLIGDQLRAAATDGIRLVSAYTSAPPGSDGMAQVIVPTKAVGILRKLLGKAAGEIAVAVSENALEVRAGSVRVVTKTVDGTFYDYRRIIPADDAGGVRMVVARDDLIHAVGGVGAVVNAEGEKKLRRVRFDLKDGANAHTISALDSAGSSAREEVVATVDGGDAMIEIDQRFLLSLAGVFAEGGSLTMRFTGASPTPVCLTSDKDPDLVAVVQSIGVPGMAHG